MHNDLTFFNNEPGHTLLERFKTTLKDVKFFDVLVGYFRTSGFHMLSESLETIEKIRILVGIGADNKTVEIIKIAKQQILNFNEISHSETKSIFSQTLEKEIYESDDTYEVESGIKKFIEFINSDRLEIKAHPSQNIHAKVYISRFHEDDRDFGRVITGSSNFSYSGLQHKYEFNVELKNRSDVEFAQKKFEELWVEAVDLSNTYIETITEKTWLNDEITPYHIFLKFLYEYLKDDINSDEDIKAYLPEGFMELRYQKQAVSSISKILDQYNGVFIADVVGLGKTYISALFAQSIPGRKLIICPPPIIDSWESAFREFGVKNFQVCSIGKLDSLVTKGTDQFDYIFVDEAHRFRNEETNQYKMLHEICWGKKVLLISATPLNNSIYDFYALLKLFQIPTNSDIPGMKNLEAFFTHIKNSLSQYDNSSAEYLEEVKRFSKEVRDKVLKFVMIRRTRTDVQRYFKDDIENQGLFFPEVENPQRLVYEFDSKSSKVFNKSIHLIKSLSYARYTPGLYISDNQAIITDFDKQQEINMAGFMRSRLLKRLESSKYAFEKSLARFITSQQRFIEMYQQGVVYVSKKIDVYEYLDNDDEEELIKKIEELDGQVFESKDFNDRFLPDLKNDLQILEDIRDMWLGVNDDFKLKRFVEELNILLKDSSKLVIFTESKETGEYLYHELEKLHNKQVLLFTSSLCIYENRNLNLTIAKDFIRDNFDPNSKNTSDEIRLLITTDVLAEGVNLHRSNKIINYDLPWNPTRVMQRVGRINRVGTKHKNIYIYNFFPTSETDTHLGLENNIKSKIQAFHETLGEDAKYLSEEEEFTNHKLFGENLYEKLNSKDTYIKDDLEENIELKYLELIRSIRDKDEDLFQKIKKLPRKARSARNYENLESDSLITFFRKGKLKKFYFSDIEKSKELSFDEAVRIFECDSNCKKESIPASYFNLLDRNKEQFGFNDAEEVIFEKSKKGRSNEKIVIERLNVAMRDKKLTDEEITYLRLVLKTFNHGVVPKSISKAINKQIEEVEESIGVYSAIKRNLPEKYIKLSKPSLTNENISEIILSEFLLKDH